jgi:predicted GNAT superfamily acetyltransferase
MAGVLEPYQNRGVGRMLKLEQRREALSRGIRLIEWTFDPLELRNAYFNIERLGVIVRRYVLNQYGTTTSKLHAGMPTDRCVAEWWLGSERTRAIIEGAGRQREPIRARIAVPVEIAVLRRENLPKALEIQKAVSNQFLDHFDRGLAVTGFERSDKFGTYLLSEWP